MRKSLLLVDDEPALLETMKELLLMEDDALQIYTARNGLEALQILLNHSIDCVVSDMKMPGLDGLGLIQKAREFKIGVPFIFYSGHACDQLLYEARKWGALDLICKPQFQLLEQTIWRTLAPPIRERELLA